MDEELSFLPDAYLRYFDLRCQGMDFDRIARELDIPADAMEAFVTLAHAKLVNPG